MAKKPKQRVREEERRLRSMEFAMKNRALFDRERLMRELLSARLQADQMENYLAASIRPTGTAQTTGRGSRG